MSTSTLDDKKLSNVEASEWRLAFKSIVKYAGKQRAAELLGSLQSVAREAGIDVASGGSTAYLNSLSQQQVDSLCDDLPESDLSNFKEVMKYLRWNAMAMVVRAGKISPALGGHISTYESSAELFEVGLNYFFNAENENHAGDIVYFQGHASPGMYARGFLEGYFDEERLKHFRQEINQPGLSSYPHPWLMPDYWQFPTVSMGLSPYNAIFQAKFLKYLNGRGLQDTSKRMVWAFLGDGEMSEPESQGAAWLAGREQLDNLVFVVSCNLQRLDGPCFGNGQIIQEFESTFAGAGWKVIKVVWGQAWNKIFAKDKQGVLLKHVSALLDGDFQRFSGQSGSYWRENFFAKDPALLELVADLSDDELEKLTHGGHDIKQLYAAYKTAAEHKGQPVIILAKTIKGLSLGQIAAGQNIAHNKKKMTHEEAILLQKNLGFKISAEEVENFSFIKMDQNSDEYKYFSGQREKLGGKFPRRRGKTNTSLVAPDLSAFKAQLDGSGDREVSSTMAFSRILSTLLKDKNLKKHIVPILVDESRTFGLEGLFRQLGIYSSKGQQYEPEDKSQLMYYREDTAGQLLQEGLNEAGGIASWIAAATSYSTNDLPMIPFYVYYSMFGFQRVGDFIWSAADMRARGFIIGGTAGRTTLAGEGLQHQDGHNLLMFSFMPNCRTYDPTFSYEMAVIIQDGLRRMYQEQEDVFYYITAMNDNYLHPAMPEGAEEGILKGMYQLSGSDNSATDNSKKVRLLGGGAILLCVMEAAEILKNEYAVDSDVWGVTSFNELAREVNDVNRHNLLRQDNQRQSYVEECLPGDSMPVVVATDYLKLYADQVRSAIKAPYYVLGTDGFGRSGDRVALRDFFEVDAKHIVYASLRALENQGSVTAKEVAAAAKKLNINLDKVNPVFM